MTSQKSNSESSLPMFYSSPRPLDRVSDGKLKLQRPTNYNFAAKTNAIPILIDEFPLASAYYPIVFATGEIPVPAAIVGLKNDENLFVSPDNGAWIKNAYLPAYVRRYPFIMMDDPDNQQFVLCIDEDCDLMKEDGEFPLFEADNPSEFTKSAMEFCAALRQQGEVTDEFVKELKKYELLISNNAEITGPDGTKFILSGFNTIDPKKFDDLSDDTILEWHKKGWLWLVYAQLLSSHKWPDLVNLDKARKEGYSFLYTGQAIKNSNLYLYSRNEICNKKV